MPKYRVVFVNGEKRELIVDAFVIRGNDQDDKGDTYTFKTGSTVVAVVPKCQVLYVELINDPGETG